MARSDSYLLIQLVLVRAALTAFDRDVTVDTKYGKLRGERYNHPKLPSSDAVTNMVDRYLGVPYAAPPVKDLRFEPPIPPQPWKIVRDALKHGWVCPQISIFHNLTADPFQKEDCLYMDIYTPYEHGKPDRLYPVMVFIHGGSFEVGSGKLYNGEVLARFGVVVVTINYRLGCLGFLSSGDRHLSGNYGLLDQVQALKWIRENIKNFRGNPEIVTIFGHSAGGASVGLLLLLPQASGLFHRAIAQSGSALAAYSVHDSTKTDFTSYIQKVGILFNCSFRSTGRIVACLKRVSVQSIIANRYAFPLYEPIGVEFRPIVDGRVVVDCPRAMFNDGRFHKVPLIVGTVHHEFENYFNGGSRSHPRFDVALDNYVRKYVQDEALFELVRHEYTNYSSNGNQLEEAIFDRGALLSDMHMVAPTVDIAEHVSVENPKTYQYHFNTKASYHSMELNYVFGAPFSGIYADEMSGSNINFTEEDEKLSIVIMTLWSNFAKYGNPTPQGKEPYVEWDTFSHVNKKYLYLSTNERKIKYNLRSEKVAFWNNIVPMIYEHISRIKEAAPWKNNILTRPVFLGVTVTLVVLVVVLGLLLVRLFIENRRYRTFISAYGVRSEAPANA